MWCTWIGYLCLIACTCAHAQVVFTEDGLSRLWNELVRDGEIQAANRDKKEEEAENVKERKSPFDVFLEEWTWGQVRMCLSVSPYSKGRGRGRYSIEERTIEAREREKTREREREREREGGGGGGRERREGRLKPPTLFDLHIGTHTRASSRSSPDASI